jgi:DNA-binding transcriptional MerR regulator
MDSRRKVFTIGKVAALIGRSPQTLRQWDLAGRLVPKRTETGDRIYSPEQVEQARRMAAAWDKARAERGAA